MLPGVFFGFSLTVFWPILLSIQCSGKGSVVLSALPLQQAW